MKKLGIQPTNHVRFAFWGAEESGPPQWGSQHYVDQLGEPDEPRLEDIALYLNVDMIGSPNYVRFVYDGASQGPDPGSVQIETVFNDYFGSQGLDTEPTPLDGRSDYQAFLNAGIPAGGATSGSDGIKTPEQATLYGGTAGKPYDPCYHKACDTIDNLNPKSIDESPTARRTQRRRSPRGPRRSTAPTRPPKQWPARWSTRDRWPLSRPDSTPSSTAPAKQGSG